MLCYQLKMKVVLAHSNSAGFRCFLFFFFHGFKCQFEFSRRTKCFVFLVGSNVMYSFFFFFTMSLEAQLIF